MKYSYTRVFRVQGVEHRGNQETLVLPDTMMGIRAVLAKHVDAYCVHGDRILAIANLVMQPTGKTGSTSLATVLPAELERVREERNTRYGKGPFLVIEVMGEADAQPSSRQKEFTEFVINEEGDPSNAILPLVQQQSSALLLAIALETGGSLTVELVGDSLVFFREDGKPMYYFTGSTHFELSQFDPLGEGAPESIAQRYDKLRADASLRRVVQLLVSSLQTDQDRLRSFLAGWNALEILIHKLFPACEAQLFRELAKGEHPKARHAYLENIRSVMKAKYRLADKFRVIAVQLCPTEADGDVTEMMSAKETRDALAHGKDIADKDLPVGSVQTLVQKYLMLHMGGSFERRPPISLARFGGRLAFPFDA